MKIIHLMNLKRGVISMKWFIPREHGAWAMLIVPYIIGMFASKATVSHLLFFIGVLAFYFSSGPLLAWIRQPKLRKEASPAFFIYITIGLVFTIPFLFLMPKLILIGIGVVPFFLLNLLFAKLKKERLFINDLFAIVALSFLVLIAYFIGNGEINNRSLLLQFINIIFFTASVFHVKTLIREKGNILFLKVSNVYHAFTIGLFAFIGLPMIALIFLFTSVKAWFMPKTRRYKPLQIGLIEIANSLLFVIVIGWFY